MPIPDIRLDNVRIRDIVIPDVPKWMSSDPPQANPALPPVTTIVGTPIVNIPGCVEAHKDNKENVNLKNEDDKGRRYVNIYAADNDSRISDFMLSEAIEKIVDISTDYVSLSDAVVDGEELVYEMLTDEEIKNLRGE